MKNIILGSGIVGLLAKHILGKDWTVIPYYKSRFYSFNPALCDNFIIHDKRIEPYIKDLIGSTEAPLYIYKLGWSISGQIIKQFDQQLCDDWILKTTGQHDTHCYSHYIKNHFQPFIYSIRINELYGKLMQYYLEELKEESAKGPITSISDHKYVRNGETFEYDNIISTIPLNILFKTIGVQNNLQSKPTHYLHIQTEYLDFEGCNQLLVVDKIFNFYKVINVAPQRYVIYCQDEISNPGQYLMSIIKNFDIIDGTSINNTLIIGDPPDLVNLEKIGIYCVGSYAQWDDRMDIGSCIIRLLNFAQHNETIKRHTIA